MLSRFVTANIGSSIKSTSLSYYYIRHGLPSSSLNIVQSSLTFKSSYTSSTSSNKYTTNSHHQDHNNIHNNNQNHHDDDNSSNFYDSENYSRKNPLDLTTLDKNTNYNSEDYLVLKEYFKTKQNTAEAFVSQLFKERSNNLVPVLKWVVCSRYLSNSLFNQLFQLSITLKNSRFLIPFIQLLNDRVNFGGLHLNELTIDAMIDNYFFDDKTTDVANLPAESIQSILEHPRCAYRIVTKVLRNVRNKDTIATLLLYNEVMANIPSSVPVDPLVSSSDLTGYSLVLPKHQFHSRVFESLLKIVKPSSVPHVIERVILDALKVGRPDLALLWLARRSQHHRLLPSASVLKWFLAYFRLRHEFNASHFWDNYYMSLYHRLPAVEPLIAQFLQVQPNRMLLNLPAPVPLVNEEQLHLYCKKVRAENAAKVAAILRNNYFRNNKNVYSMLPSCENLMPAICTVHLSETIDIAGFVESVPAMLRSVVATPGFVSPLFVGNVERALTLLAHNQHELQLLFAHSHQIWNALVIGLVNAGRFDLAASVVSAAVAAEIKLQPSTVEYCLAKTLANLDIVDNNTLKKLEDMLVPSGQSTSGWTHSMLNCRLSALVQSGDTTSAGHLLQQSDKIRNSLSNKLATLIYLGRQASFSSLADASSPSLQGLLEFARVDTLDSGMVSSLLDPSHSNALGRQIAREYIDKLINSNTEQEQQEMSPLVMHELFKLLVEENDPQTLILLFKSLKPQTKYPSDTKRILQMANEHVNDQLIDNILKTTGEYKLHPILPSKPTCTLSESSITYLKDQFLQQKISHETIYEYNNQ